MSFLLFHLCLGVSLLYQVPIISIFSEIISSNTFQFTRSSMNRLPKASAPYPWRLCFPSQLGLGRGKNKEPYDPHDFFTQVWVGLLWQQMYLRVPGSKKEGKTTGLSRENSQWIQQAGVLQVSTKQEVREGCGRCGDCGGIGTSSLSSHGDTSWVAFQPFVFVQGFHVLVWREMRRVTHTSSCPAERRGLQWG